VSILQQLTMDYQYLPSSGIKIAWFLMQCNIHLHLISSDPAVKN